MNASDVMVHDVVTIGPDEPVLNAVRLLTDHDISALPVVDDEAQYLVGRASGPSIGVLRIREFRPPPGLTPQ